ncbi:MAG: flavodoxin family protein [Mobilitalea sp.]
MKAIIYYSLDGNTDFIAQKIATKVGAELIRLIPKKEYPTGKVSKFIWGGKSVTFGEKPKLVNEVIDLQRFDTLFIGTPIWSGKFAPPLNTFLHENDIKGKNIFLFACHMGGGAEKCFLKMRALLGDNNIMGTMEFVDPLTNPKDDTDTKIEGFFKSKY